MIRCPPLWSTAPTRLRRALHTGARSCSFVLSCSQSSRKSPWCWAGLSFLFSVESFSEFVEASFPEASITADPCVELAEGLRAKRVEALLSFGTDPDEARLLQDAQVSRNSRLLNLDFFDQFIDRVLAMSQGLDDTKPHGVGKSLEDSLIHVYVYTL